MKTTKTTAGQTAKVFATIAVVCGLIFTSCKKDRVCTCSTTSTDNYGGTTTTSTSTSTTTIKKVNKQHGNLACSSSTYSSSSGGSTYTSTSTCTLK